MESVPREEQGEEVCNEIGNKNKLKRVSSESSLKHNVQPNPWQRDEITLRTFN